MANTVALSAYRIVFEADSADHANAVVLREADETLRCHLWRSRLFRMACAIGLLDEGTV